MILELGEGKPQVRFIRVAYDIDATARGVRDAGLPEDFVEYFGSMINMDDPKHFRFMEAPVLVIAGEGPGRQALEARIAATHERTDVRLVGHRGDLPDLVARRRRWGQAAARRPHPARRGS